MRLSALLPLACFALPVCLLAQTAGRPHFVRASGQATVSMQPDRAMVDIGVTSHAATAESASAQNATQTTQMLQAIRRELGSAGEVKTAGYSLNAQYDFANGHRGQLNGYDASNTLLVTVDDLTRVGKILDAATKSGANNINGISFTLKDDRAARAAAMRQAAAAAKENAEALAKALNVEVVGVLEAEPSEAQVIRPMGRQAFASAMAAPAAPVEAGTLTIDATVVVTLEIR